jgi:hypothetical protein
MLIPKLSHEGLSHCTVIDTIAMIFYPPAVLLVICTATHRIDAAIGVPARLHIRALKPLVSLAPADAAR